MHVTLALVAAVTVHVLPSMTIKYFDVSSEKLFPLNVTDVPPVTVPNLGFIPESKGVSDPE